MAFGNILFGGVIGVGVDVATGAAYDYPDVISIPLLRSTGTPAAVALPVAAVVPAAPLAEPATAVAVPMILPVSAAVAVPSAPEAKPTAAARNVTLVGNDSF